MATKANIESVQRASGMIGREGSGESYPGEAANDRMQGRSIEPTRGVEPHHDPVSNSTVQLDHTFGNAWRVDNLDAYILTKDSNFNPGLYGFEATHEGRGRRVARLRPGRRAILDTSALVAVLLRVPGSDAAMNFGDCLSYATAVIAAESLLCIGDDFAQTDCLLA